MVGRQYPEKYTGKIILWLHDPRACNSAFTGGKNSATARMYQAADKLDIRVPAGFAITTRGYSAWKSRSSEWKKMCQEIIAAYQELTRDTMPVAVRSSATVEDAPGTSFAGQFSSFLYVRGEKELIRAVINCYRSRDTQRVKEYCRAKNITHADIMLSVGVQVMIPADRATAGIIFTCDPVSGNRDMLMINAAPGLGEQTVQGIITPDEFLIHRSTDTVVRAVSGSKNNKKLCITGKQVHEIAQAAVRVEKYFNKILKNNYAYDIEWAYNNTHELYIIQARPETVFTSKNTVQQVTQLVPGNYIDKKIIQGIGAGNSVAAGIARYVTNPHKKHIFNNGDILVARSTTPDWVPLMRRAGGLVTDQGGRTCHAAIVSRELGIPAIVGTQKGTKNIKAGTEITVDARSGIVYGGILPTQGITISRARMMSYPVPLMCMVSDPDRALVLAQGPWAGVGLVRTEFALGAVGIHPASLHERDYSDFVQQMVNNIAPIVAAFYPRPVIVRTVDFKSNEYRLLRGGDLYEPVEENPMLGLRGASRYLHTSYEKFFELECAIYAHIYNNLGFKNFELLIPFVRSAPELKSIVKKIKEYGISCKISCMLETPANMLLVRELGNYCDGFSIGSNDLTQLTVGVDRDNALVAHEYSENNPAVRELIIRAIISAHAINKKITLCGQGPSDSCEFADFLIASGIDGITINPDSEFIFV